MGRASAVIHFEGEYTCTGSDPNKVDRATAVICTEGEYTCTSCNPNSVDRATAVNCIEGEYTCTGRVYTCTTTVWRGPLLSFILKVSIYT